VWKTEPNEKKRGESKHSFKKCSHNPVNWRADYYAAQQIQSVSEITSSVRSQFAEWLNRLSSFPVMHCKHVLLFTIHFAYSCARICIVPVSIVYNDCDFSEPVHYRSMIGLRSTAKSSTNTGDVYFNEQSHACHRFVVSCIPV
jgi:hypothetical protein